MLHASLCVEGCVINGDWSCAASRGCLCFDSCLQLFGARHRIFNENKCELEEEFYELQNQFNATRTSLRKRARLQSEQGFRKASRENRSVNRLLTDDTTAAAARRRRRRRRRRRLPESRQRDFRETKH